MSEPPIVGQHGEPPEEDELDGVVLFDPGPLPSMEDPEAVRKPQLLRSVLLITLMVVVAAGGYQIYESRASAVPSTTTFPPLAPFDGGVRREAQLATTEDDVAGQVGSSVTLAVRATGPAGGPLSDSLVQFRVVEASQNSKSTGSGFLVPNLRCFCVSNIASVICCSWISAAPVKSLNTQFENSCGLAPVSINRRATSALLVSLTAVKR